MTRTPGEKYGLSSTQEGKKEAEAEVRVSSSSRAGSAWGQRDPQSCVHGKRRKRTRVNSE